MNKGCTFERGVARTLSRQLGQVPQSVRKHGPHWPHRSSLVTVGRGGSMATEIGTMCKNSRGGGATRTICAANAASEAAMAAMMAACSSRNLAMSWYAAGENRASRTWMWRG